MTKAILALSLICATTAFAIPVDPAPDHIGVYFDSGATTTNFDSTPNVPFNAYVVITNPTAADILGAEFGYRLVVPAGYEDSYTRLDNILPPMPVDLGDNESPSEGEYFVGLAAPLPQADAVVFVTWQLVLTDDFPIDIYLGPAWIQSTEDGFPAYGSDDSMRVLVPSSGDVTLPVATINGGVSDVPGHALRNPVVLEQCQPNPFNPQTTIGYFLAREGRVTLQVRDVSGHTVRTLVDDRIVTAGGHEAVWDGKDNAGREAASGVYLCGIEALGTSATRRMVLVR